MSDTKILLNSFKTANSVIAVQDYSLYTQELLGKPPGWLLRWGGFVVLGCLATLLAASWQVKYPDVISASVTITTPQPPIRIVSQRDGQIRWLRKGERDRVSQGETLAWIDNPADIDAVGALRQWFANNRKELFNGNIIALDMPPENLALGELNEAYAAFYKSLDEFRFFLQQQPFAQKRENARVKQGQLQQMLKQHESEQAVLKEQKSLLEGHVTRYQKLIEKHFVAEQAVDDKRLDVLRNAHQQEQLSIEQARTQLEITRLAGELISLDLANQQQQKDYRLRLEENYQKLLSSVDSWEKNYLLTAPITGRLVKFKFWSDKQFVKAGEEVVTVVPEQEQGIIAKINMPLANSGKVKQGQKILIKLAGYPFQEFGLIESQVDMISLLPDKDHYSVQAKLAYPLKTSANKTLPFEQEMQGRAEIVTEDMRLLERVFYQIRRLLLDRSNLV
ncbi:MAG: HlyD family efflux transporter periplasmic adaptor subunit [Methylicorpusculum sp.]|uniref:HlyD family secretion protein n=1 Tax=Methylicorpusculum sp. TaxID=2713644 RepID=UPI002715DD5D|nr:HlyD family efflux transporter periplasmic adaptor subunit [Methylicorpusculum sp.]MDO8940253.1 HlyD family efflux transporter periplasmic adaptor subunit [Methylicorpusculum sp.]MDO9239439.1 HlyD family efflux transporter periplasmic adaptor subunit [Methylicorpusculum sp.]MDP2201262.1 HlyD family efflux transporter periplasmic adaptor subunit [Methylicorpusculum sp.]